MNDYSFAWNLSRGRFLDTIKDLNAEQLNWRSHAGSLTIGEMSIHVAGVEVYFISQLLDLELDEFLTRVRMSSTEGVVNDHPFPFDATEITPDLVDLALAQGKTMVELMIEAPTPEFLAKEIKSALGPMISGHGALARFTFHPAYHQGQAYFMRTSPNFPN